MSEIVEATPWKAKIANVVEWLGTQEQVDCPLRHYFAPGVYIREIFMPAGSFVIGKIHKTEHFNVVLKGKFSIVSEDRTETFEGPYTFVSKAGVQKALYIHEDTVWQTIHLTTERDLDSLEAQLVEPDPSYPTFPRTEERAAVAAAARLELQLEHIPWHGQQ
jgi:hypothetical protein